MVCEPTIGLMNPLILDGQPLALAEIEAVSLSARPVAIAPAALARIAASRARIEQILAADQTVYGVNTGFGRLSDLRVPHESLERLQTNLVRSHAGGIGQPLSEAEARAMLLLRANVLAKGFSGCRTELVELLASLLNAGVHPVIPEKGSVGASGDLAPLAHLALVVIGEGEALYKSERLTGGEALRRAGLRPLNLAAKEGLALLNGTQAMTAVGALALARSRRVARLADLAGAMSLEALMGTPAAFDPRIHAVRPHLGQIAAAQHLMRLMEDSEIREAHRERDSRVQDAYCLRCMPQVHGAVRDTLAFARSTFAAEANAAVDNPLVFASGRKGEGEILSGGNFHGQPLAFALDYCAIALTALAGISERRTERMVNPSLNEGLPAFLAPDPGLHSGLMMAQVTAAALVAENRVLAHPASVDSITTSGNKEDYVSMGMGAALKLRQVVANTAAVLGIELVAASHALVYLEPLRPGRKLQAVLAQVRRRVPPLTGDRVQSGDIAAAQGMVLEGLGTRG